MSKEGRQPLQFDMFSGELVDARTGHQKKKDRERDTPQQTMMFKTQEVVQFGGKKNSAYREWLDQATAPPLILESQDTRTPEEIEQDFLREAQKHTISLFEDTLMETPEVEKENAEPLHPLPRSAIVFEAQTHQQIIGFRAKLRRHSLAGKVRRRTS
ncbi:MAG: hypothetical protein HS103_08045 [Anaerolineales bacterium]|nr:hypothetical protein [Anaerolineales bacterium]